MKLILILFCFTSCTVQTNILKNGYQRVPSIPTVYKNRIYFNKSDLRLIDTSAVYEEYNTSFYVEDKPVYVLARQNYQNPNTIYQVYRFYGNGCFNLFNLDRDSQTIKKEMFDPTFTGWRGVIYRKNDKILGDLITQVSGSGAIGIITENFEFKGDTLLVHAKNRWNYIYIKRQIPTDLLNFSAEW